ncbi:MAG: Uncharacterized protein G01um101429_406 [Parcubacteria group bacterium Gr01-1014_29]|nr:MAG: Uncharacterized protein G01um101429_406 [Parcubacteria group bacterium Gr01-1014_29]
MKNVEAEQKIKQKIPHFLQPFLWSVNIDGLDVNEDKVYIINQILAFGDMKALAWIFKTYSLHELRDVFSRHGMRIYREAGFYFVKDILLGIREVFDPTKYVSTKF